MKKKLQIKKILRIYISTENFFKFNEIEIKDLVFKKADFNIKKKFCNFFNNLLNGQPNENKFEILKSNNFFLKSKMMKFYL